MTTTQLRPTARSTRPLAFGRTFLTELRKLVDTRASLAVVIGVLLLERLFRYLKPRGVASR